MEVKLTVHLASLNILRLRLHYIEERRLSHIQLSKRNGVAHQLRQATREEGLTPRQLSRHRQ